MLVSEIITLARRWTFTDANQYTDANALIDFNVVYRRTIALISEAVNQELYADYF